MVEDLHKQLVYIVLPIVSLLICIGPEIFYFVFGEQWKIAGEFAKWLAPLLYFQFLASPLSVIFPVTENQRKGLLFQLFMLVTRISSIIIGYSYGDLLSTVILFSFSSSFCYAVLLIWVSIISGATLSNIFKSNLFAIILRWFSAGGFAGWEDGIILGLKSLTLPAIALALPQASILARVMRSSLIDILSEDFMKTARAKGLSFKNALIRHGIRNALIPVLTIIGLQFSFLMAGAIIIENVFFLPGLGRLIFQSIAQRDIIVVESVIMLLVFSVVLVTFIVDIAYVIVDPRLRSSIL